MRILLVSDTHHFSTQHVFNGYVEGFQKLGVPFDVADYGSLNRFFNQEISLGLMMSKALVKANGFTHVVLISGLSIPPFFLESLYDKKLAVVALDDPHSSMTLMQQKHNIDYYFTNERTMACKDAGIYYLPTATSSNLPLCPKDQLDPKYRSDIVFVGTIYPNRAEMLEEVAKYCIENRVNFKCVGPVVVPAESIPSVIGFLDSRVTSAEEAKLYYRGADIVINSDRDINWSQSGAQNPLLFDTGKGAESLNPRSYEVAGCQTIQLFTNYRQEAKDLFGDNSYYATTKEDAIQKITEIRSADKETLIEKARKCFEVVQGGHFYVHRALKMIETFKENEKDG